MREQKQPFVASLAVFVDGEVAEETTAAEKKVAVYGRIFWCFCDCERVYCVFLICCIPLPCHFQGSDLKSRTTNQQNRYMMLHLPLYLQQNEYWVLSFPSGDSSLQLPAHKLRKCAQRSLALPSASSLPLACRVMANSGHFQTVHPETRATYVRKKVKYRPTATTYNVPTSDNTRVGIQICPWHSPPQQ